MIKDPTEKEIKILETTAGTLKELDQIISYEDEIRSIQIYAFVSLLILFINHFAWL